MTSISSQLYEAFADLLEYPDRSWGARLEAARRAVTAETADGAVEFFRFYRSALPLSMSELEELYTRTFDLNPACALEIGYHLFGENYKRGELLASLRETEAPYSIGQHNQLPDYLPVLLRLIGKLEDEQLRTSLIGECILPALEKMNEELSKAANPYGDLLLSVQSALKVEAPESRSAPLPSGWENAGRYQELYRISSRDVLKV